LLDVAEALAFAHSQGVVHRDLKPANILVGPFGETVVIDWGLAKLTSEAAARDFHAELGIPRAGFTRAGLVVGTPPYLSPEQAEGKEVDKTFDTYALGAILYHALSGQLPYADTPSEQLLEKIRKEPPKPLGSLAPDLPPDLLAIVSKAMSRQPAERYADGKELAQELQRFTTGSLVKAYDYRFGDLLKRFVRRNLAAVVVGVVALLVIIALGTISISRVRTERDLARENESLAQRQLGLAEERAQALIVTQASALTDSDPTQAVAWLKRLVNPISSAPSVAARAEEYGVARWVLRGHEDAVTCLDLSQDARLLLSGGDDHQLRLWTLGDPAGKVLQRHGDRITDCAFSPDGKWAAGGSYDGQVTLWDMTQQRLVLLPSQGDAIVSLAFGRDGKQLISTSANDKFRVWQLSDHSYRDYVTPNARYPFLDASTPGQALSGPHAGRARRWLFDGTFLESPELDTVTVGRLAGPSQALLGTTRGTVHVWDWGRSTLTALTELGAQVTALATRSEAPSFVAVADRAGDVVRVDLATHQTTGVMRHTERVMALAVSEGERFIASGGWDKGVRLFDTVSRDARLLRGHSDVISELRFSKDEHLLVTASWDKTLRVWPLGDPLHARRRVLMGHSVGVHSVRFSPDGRLLASGGHDNTVRLWDLEHQTHRVLLGHRDHVYRVLFSPDGRWLASSSDDHTVRLWSTRDGTCHQVFTEHEGDVEELAFSPDGRLLVSASEDQTARVWELETGASAVLYHDHAVTQISFHPSGKWFATGSRAGDVRVFDSKSATQLAVHGEQGGEVFAVGYSPDGKWLASSSTSGQLTLRDVESGRRVRWSSLPGANGIAFSPNGRWMSVSGTSPNLWLCQVENGICAELQGHQSQVRTMRFLADSSTLVTAGGDGDTFLWDIDSGEHRVYKGHRAPVFDMDVSPDSRWIATASADETVRLWPVARVVDRKDLPSALDALSHETITSALEP
jgi:WD40 repeat protein